MAWRELDPRAAQSADRIEDRMRAAGITVPDTAAIRDHNRDAIAAGYLRDQADEKGAQARDEESPGSDPSRTLGGT